MATTRSKASILEADDYPGIASLTARETGLVLAVGVFFLAIIWSMTEFVFVGVRYTPVALAFSVGFVLGGFVIFRLIELRSKTRQAENSND